MDKTPPPATEQDADFAFLNEIQNSLIASQLADMLMAIGQQKSLSADEIIRRVQGLDIEDVQSLKDTIERLGVALSWKEKETQDLAYRLGVEMEAKDKTIQQLSIELAKQIAVTERLESEIAHLRRCVDEAADSQDRKPKMDSAGNEMIIARAWRFAEELGQAYCTVEHLLAVAFPMHASMRTSLMHSILKIPKREAEGVLEPTLAFQRVARRMNLGISLVDSVHAEGEQAWCAKLLADHGMPNSEAIASQMVH